MKQTKLSLLLLLVGCSYLAIAQDESENYVEFNDRNNVVHGVYMGLSAHYGEIKNTPTYGGSFKIAYVANQQLEVGLGITAFQSDQPLITSDNIDNKLTAGYVGMHLEPILFSKSKVNLSFPLLLGAGAIGYLTTGQGDFDDNFIDTEFENINVIFVAEPGVSALFNVSRYLQLEAGIKYRFSNKIDLATSPIKRLNGFSAGIGVKVGVFNMGRNRYKKKI